MTSPHDSTSNDHIALCDECAEIAFYALDPQLDDFDCMPDIADMREIALNTHTIIIHIN